MTNEIEMNDNVPVRPAATVALLRDTSEGPEVFMLQRNSSHVFAARAYVYPGGAVDPVDSNADILNCYCNGDAAAADSTLGEDGALCYWTAAMRECFEEAGVLVGSNADHPLAAEALSAARDELNAGVLGWEHIVERLALRFDAGALRYFAHWTTPPGMSRRFSTRFFAARMPAGQSANPDGSETTRGEWLRPAQALERHRAGDIYLMRPTIDTLKQLGEYPDTDVALEALATVEVTARP